MILKRIIPLASALVLFQSAGIFAQDPSVSAPSVEDLAQKDQLLATVQDGEAQWGIKNPELVEAIETVTAEEDLENEEDEDAVEGPAAEVTTLTEEELSPDDSDLKEEEAADADVLAASKAEEDSMALAKTPETDELDMIGTDGAPDVEELSVAARHAAFSANLRNWLRSGAGQKATKFCIGLKVFDFKSIYKGCLEDMKTTGDEEIAKAGAFEAASATKKDKTSNHRRCVATGDPHYTNYNGDYFHLQRPGYFVLARSHDNSFEVQERQLAISHNVACAYGFAVRYRSITVELPIIAGHAHQMWVNGRYIHLHHNRDYRFGGVKVRYGHQNFEWRGAHDRSWGIKVSAPNGFAALIPPNWCGGCEVNLPRAYVGKMQGLCGTGNGRPGNHDYRNQKNQVMNVRRGTSSWGNQGYWGKNTPLAMWQKEWRPYWWDCLFRRGCDPGDMTRYQSRDWYPAVYNLRGCPAGRYQAKNGMPCYMCPKGRYQPRDRVYSRRCKDCSKGKYQDMVGMRSCKRCTGAGAYSETGWRKCKFCPAGHYASKGVCYDCKEGQFGKDGKCASCPPGKMGKPKHGCSNCGSGQYQDKFKKMLCMKCAAGAFVSRGNASCNTCPGGKCEDCPAGTFSPAGASSCVSCTPGLFRGHRLPFKLLNPTEDLRTYSSIHANDAPGYRYGRSMLDSPQAWSSGPARNGEWTQMDLGKVRALRKIVLQPRKDANQAVSKFSLKYSVDGKTFKDVEKGKVFTGSSRSWGGSDPRNAQVEVALDLPVEARYVRLVVEEYYSHPSMRWAVYVSPASSYCATCAAGTSSKEGAPKCTKCKAGTFSKPRAMKCSSCKAGTYRQEGPLDIVVNPPDSARTYSSTHGNDRPGYRWARGMLDSPEAWITQSARVGDWAQLDLGKRMPVSKVVMQPRENSYQSVTQFTLKVSNDGSTWSDVDGGAVFQGSPKGGHGQQTQTKSTVAFAEPVEARYVRLFVTAYYGHPCMRWAVVVQPGGACPSCGAGTYSAGGKKGEPSEPCAACAPGQFARAKARICDQCAPGLYHPIREPGLVNVIDSARTYSTTHGNDSPGYRWARGMLDSPQAWIPSGARTGQWAQMDLGAVMTVSQIIMQPRKDANQAITKFSLVYSKNGKKFYKVNRGMWFDGNSPTFTGDDSRNTKKTVTMPTPFEARYVRLIVEQYVSYPCMRWAVTAAPLGSACLTCPAGTRAPAKAAKCTTCPSGTFSPSGNPDCLRCNPGSFREQKSKAAEEVLFNPAEKARKYSSTHGNDRPGYRWARSMLDSPQAWIAQTGRVGDWAQADLGKTMAVSKVVIQPRKDSYQSVTQFTVKVSTDGENWKDVDGGAVFVGNSKSGNGAQTDQKRVVAFNKPVFARYVRLTVKKYSSFPCMRFAFMVQPGASCPKCAAGTFSAPKLLFSKTMGRCQACKSGTFARRGAGKCAKCPRGKFRPPIKSTLVNPLESVRTYSSIHGNDWPGYRYGRSMLDSPQGWSSGPARTEEWTQIDLGQIMRVTEIITQPRKDANQCVSKYALKYSTNGLKWKNVDSGNWFEGNSRHWTGSDPRNVKKVNDLPNPFEARYVRLVVKEYYSHPSMRWAVTAGTAGSVCQMCAAGTYSADSGTSSCTVCAPGTYAPVGTGSKGAQCPTCKAGRFRGATHLEQMVNPPEKKRTYSSTHGNDRPGYRWARSMLDSPQAWIARTSKTGDWTMMDLGKTMAVSKVIMQPRKDSYQAVTRFTLDVSTDGSTFKKVDGGAVFDGSPRGGHGNNANFKRVVPFQNPIEARFVRLTVVEFYSFPSMRWAVMVQPGGRCARCTPGSFSQKAAKVCTDCAAGNFSVAGKSSCQGCAAGTFRPAYEASWVNPPEAARTYSSVHGNDWPGYRYGRSMLNSPQGWSAGPGHIGEWAQMDLGQIMRVSQIILQPRKDANQGVTKFSLMISEDGKVFKPVGDDQFFDGSPRSISSQQDRDVKTIIKVDPFEARFVRMVVEEFTSFPSMRWAVAAGAPGSFCETCAAGSAAGPASPACSICQPGTFATFGAPKCAACASGKYRAKTPAEVLVNPPELSRTYSTTHGNDRPGYRWARSMLDSPQAWITENAEVGDWTQMDLGVAMVVNKVVIQPRRDHYQSVTQFTVKVSMDGNVWTDVDGGNVFQGSPKGGNDNDNNIKRTVAFQAPVTARFVRLTVADFYSHPSMRWAVVVQLGSTCPSCAPGTFSKSGSAKCSECPAGTYGKTEACAQCAPGTFRPAVVPALVNPADRRRSYSSVHGNDRLGYRYGRGMLDSPQGWSSGPAKTGEWAQMDLGSLMTVSKIIVQPRKDANQAVTKYTLKYSVDGKTFKDVNFGEVFAGNDRSTFTRNLEVKAVNTLPVPFEARYVRLVVHEYYSHPSMRWAVEASGSGSACGKCGAGTYSALAASKCTACDAGTYAKIASGSCTKCPSGKFRAASAVESMLNPPESKRTYSSVYHNDKPGYRYGRSMLDSPQAWSAKNSGYGEWAQMDLGKTMTVTKIVMQPRKDAQQDVTKFTVKVSTNGREWQDVDGGTVFQGNSPRFSDNNRKETVAFQNPIEARFVRLIVVQYYSHPSMRWAIIVEPGDKCHACAAGAYSVTGGTACKACKGGSFPAKGGTGCAQCEAGKYRPEPYAQLVNPIETTRTYSSIHGNDSPGYGHGRSMLNSPQAWSPGPAQVGEWAQIDLGQRMTVSKLVMQPRKNHNQAVTKFTLSYSDDNRNFQEVNFGEVFDGCPSSVESKSDRERKTTVVLPDSIVARYVRLTVVAWTSFPSLRWALEADAAGASCKVCAAGLFAAASAAKCSACAPGTYSNYAAGSCSVCASGKFRPSAPRDVMINPPEAARTYSTTHGNDRPGYRWARSMLDSPTGWLAKTAEVGDWLQMDLGKTMTVSNVVMQPRNGHHQMIMKFRLKVSTNGQTWTDVDGGATFNGTPKGGHGFNTNMKTTVAFRSPVDARYVRLTVASYYGFPAMRWALMVQPGSACRRCAPGSFAVAGAPKCTPCAGGTYPASTSAASCTSCAAGKYRPSGKPTAVNPSEQRRQYSNIYANDAPGYSHGRSMLDSPQAWSAASPYVGEWTQLDLGSTMTVFKIILQPRKDHNQAVTKFTLAYSADGSVFKPVNDGAVFDGSPTSSWHQKDRDAKKEIALPVPVEARYIRLIVSAWYSHPSCRWGVEAGPFASYCVTCDAGTFSKAQASSCAECPAGTFAKVGAGSCSTCAAGQYRPEGPVEYLINPPELSRSYSTVWSNSAIGTGWARSMLDSPTGWLAGAARVGDWTQIDIGSTTTVSKVVMQARRDSYQAVTQFKLKVSTDGENFVDVDNGHVFNGSPHGGSGADVNFKVTIGLKTPVEARYVRLTIAQFYSHPSMRWALIVQPGGKCPLCSPGTFSAGGGACQNCAAGTIPDDGKAKCVKCAPGSFRPAPVDALVNPNEYHRAYSQVYGNDSPGYRYGRSMLDGPQAWSALSPYYGEWAQLDLGKTMTVSKIVTQPRRDHYQAITKYTLSYSVDGKTFKDVNNGEIFVVTKHMHGGNKEQKALNTLAVPFEARYVRLAVVAWYSHPSMRWAVEASPAGSACEVCAAGTFSAGGACKSCGVGQYAPAGSGTCPACAAGTFRTAGPTEVVVNPDEAARSYSSVWSNDAIGTKHARSMLDSPQAWSSKDSGSGVWSQMDLGAAMTVSKVIIQPRKDTYQAVTQFSVKVSTDGRNWKDVDGGAVFQGSPYGGHGSDNNRKMEVPFAAPVVARYVRAIVAQYYSHPSMRWAVMVQPGAACTLCGAGSFSAASAKACASCKADTFSLMGSPKCAKCEPGTFRTIKDPSLINPKEQSRSYSSVWGNNAIGTGHARSMLDSPQAWSVGPNRAGEWAQIDLGEAMSVSKIYIQPRRDHDQRVTKFTLKVSLDGRNFVDVENGKTFDGSPMTGSREQKKTVDLATPVDARYVRLVVQEWKSHASMRWGVEAGGAGSMCVKCVSADTAPACFTCEAGEYKKTAESCAKCALGSAQEDKTGIMGPCPSCVAGKFAAATGATSCASCIPGQFTPGAKTGCSSCPVGKFASSSGAGFCRDCAPGRYTDRKGAPTCTKCAGGQYQATKGSSKGCDQCAAGTFQAKIGSSTCDACPPGRSSFKFASSCTKCAAGTFTSKVGASQCDSCKPGTVSEAGANVCAECKAGTYKGTKGGSQCIVCVAGQFSAKAGATGCTACAKGSAAGAGQSSCAACKAGTFKAKEGGSQCVTCKAGKFAAGQGNTQCADCAVGSFSADAGAGACVKCPENSPFAKAGMSTCSDKICKAGTMLVKDKCVTCEAGKYATAGSLACAACDAGKYQDKVGSSDCGNCSAGKFKTAAGAGDCENCATGTHATNAGASKCEQCLAGSFQNGQGSTTCSNCSAGKFQGSPGQASCKFCVPGKRSSASAASCKACRPGKYQAAGGATTCLYCLNGSYSAAGATTCANCAVGTFQGGTGGTSCVSCVPGQYQPLQGAPDCRKCPPGFFVQTAGQTKCAACIAGLYSRAAAATCAACKPGSFQSAANQATCVKCKAGKAMSAGGMDQDDCKWCVAGRYAPEGSGTCHLCAAGKYSAARMASCTSCAAGTYQAQRGERHACTFCAFGKYAGATGKTSCDDCAGGFYANTAGSIACTACAVGKFSGPAAEACTTCKPGTFSSAVGGASCSKCAAGKYTDDVASASCDKCASGQYTPSVGASLCKSCKPGQYLPAADNTACSSCQAGTYSGEKATVCVLCDVGTYASAGATACDKCAVGTFRSTKSATQCVTCAAGTFSAAKGAKKCSMCAVGQYSAAGATKCTACARGSFAPGKGSSTCMALLCPAGQAKVAEKCTKCTAGTYSRGFESKACSKCEAGKFADVAGASICKTCAAGYTAGAAGAAKCVQCLNGFYAPIAGADKCKTCPKVINMNDDDAAHLHRHFHHTACFTSDCRAGEYRSGDKCTQCLAGEYSSAKSAACKLCRAGTFAPKKDSSVCQPCEAGQYAAVNKATSCKNCAKNSFSPSGAQGCKACPSGFHTKIDGSSICELIVCEAGTYKKYNKCKSCSAGKYSEGSAVACEKCKAGTFQDKKSQSTCTNCSAGKFQTFDGRTDCDACAPGKFSEANSGKCTACKAGTFQNTAAQSVCFNCLGGTYMQAEDATLCLACESGKFSATKSEECTDCVAGKHQPLNGQSSCVSCASGKYQPKSGESFCSACVSGQFVEGKGSSTCGKCAAGKYSSVDGSASCLACAIGKYASNTGASACVSCAAGTATRAAGSTECVKSSLLCKAGYYSKVNECIACMPGKYSHYGSTACTLCPAGTAQPKKAESSCPSCAMGTHQPLKGQVKCLRKSARMILDEVLAQSSGAEVAVGALAALAVVGTALAGVAVAVRKVTAPVATEEELTPVFFKV